MIVELTRVVSGQRPLVDTVRSYIFKSWIRRRPRKKLNKFSEIQLNYRSDQNLP